MTGNKYARPENFGHPIRTPLLREHFIYRAFNADNELLYVGCSYHPENRIREHNNTGSEWHADAVRFALAGPFNYETAREVERQAIYTERPLHNFTPERRQIATSHHKIVSREMQRLMAFGMDWSEAYEKAKDVADLLVPYPGNRGAFRIVDGQALAAKAAARAHRQEVA